MKNIIFDFLPLGPEFIDEFMSHKILILIHENICDRDYMFDHYIIVEKTTKTILYGGYDDNET